MKDTWGDISIDEFIEANPHIANLAGKNMKELHKMFPDAEVCTSESCDFNDIDHAIFMEHEQHEIDMAKRGMIKVMYSGLGDNSTKLFYWYNGKDWVKLTQ